MLAGGGLCAGVAPGRKAKVLLEAHYSNPGMFLRDPLDTSVAGCVVDNDHLEVLLGPAQVVKRGKRGAGVIGPAVVHDHDGDGAWRFGLRLQPFHRAPSRMSPSHVPPSDTTPCPSCGSPISMSNRRTLSRMS